MRMPTWSSPRPSTLKESGEPVDVGGRERLVVGEGGVMGWGGVCGVAAVGEGGVEVVCGEGGGGWGGGGGGGVGGARVCALKKRGGKGRKEPTVDIKPREVE